MAGIEKVCEFSGEYPAHLMYGYKKNQLQIMPKYRKLFRGASHRLIIQKEKLYWDRGGYYIGYSKEEWKDYEPPFNTEKDFIRWYTKEYKSHLKYEYKFTLKVTDPNLQGNVEGEYINWTYDLPTTTRKLKRMLRCKELNVVEINHEK